jgi:hypothetical protein
MSETEIVITFQSERDLWYVRRGDATAVVSAEDMVHEYYRWRRVGAPGEWGENAREFCRRRLETSQSRERRRTAIG